MSIGVIVAMAIGTIFPALTEIATRETTSLLTRALIMSALSVITGAFTTLRIAYPVGTTQWEEFLMTVTISMAASTTTYYWAWKPSGALKRIAKATSRFGIK